MSAPTRTPPGVPGVATTPRAITPVARLLRKPRVVVAGQIPPPLGGQAVMIERIRDGLTASGDFDVAHLPFFFTRHVRHTRRAHPAKLLELAAVLRRLRRLHRDGNIDLLLYPVGGPQAVPLARDLLLLPWCRLAADRLVLHFHAAGIADALDGYHPRVQRLLRDLYRRADAALVMTEFGRRDPESVGVRDVRVVPLGVPDEHDPSLVRRGGRRPVLLYVGHLCEPKGTPALLEAAARLRDEGRDFTLRLAGEALAPYSAEALAADVARLGLVEVVERCGVVTGEAKRRCFATADLLVFPTVAPYESFGLVAVEAMMWAMPVVATDWRGNREVLGHPVGGRCYVPGDDHPAALTDALRAALDARDCWPAWGEANRRRYETRYRDDGIGGGIGQALRELTR